METSENVSVLFSMSTAGYTLQCGFMTDEKDCISLLCS